MKNILSSVFIVAFILACACHGNDTKTKHVQKFDSFAIIGKVTGLDTGWIYLLHRQTGDADSMRLDHGFFKFNGKADTTELCRIQLGEHAKSFFLENGKISMLIKKDSLRDALIEGTPTQDEYNDFQDKYSKKINDEMNAVDKLYDQANAKKDQKTTDSLENVYTKLDQEQKEMVIEYARLHPGSYVSAFEIFSNFSYNTRVGQLDSLYHLLDSPMRTSYFGNLIKTTIADLKKTAIGNPAPDFSCNDVEGKLVKLSSFRGSYLLIDFWASWCGPCRRENPSVVSAYHQFHDKGFNILGVSLDDTKSDWLQAIKKDGLIWTQVSDLKGWKAEAAALYGVKAIPMNFLIDKSGFIVAKGLGEELTVAWEKYFSDIFESAFMGEAEQLNQELTIRIQSDFYFYGDAATKNLAGEIASDIAGHWNEPRGKILIKNLEFNIEFVIRGFYNPNLKPEEIWFNTNPRNNYFRIEKVSPVHVSFVDGIRCNTGYFKLDNLLNNSTTAAHEYGHTLGLEHPRRLDIRGQGQPGIMYPRGTICDPFFQYDPHAEPLMPGGTINPYTRKVLQKDIDHLRLHKLTWDGTNQAVLGDFSSIYHEKFQ